MCAHLIELLDHVERNSLGVAVDYCDLSRLHLLDQARDDEILSTALRSHEDETLIVLKKRLDKCHVTLDRASLNEWRLIRVLELFDFKVLIFK